MKGKSVLAGRPLDPEEDFDKPVKAEQAKLPGTEQSENGEPPVSVRGKMMLAKYVRPHYEKDENDVYSVSLEFSFPLTKEHESLLPAEVLTLWKVIKKGSSKKIVDIDVDPHSVDIHLAPD